MAEEGHTRQYGACQQDQADGACHLRQPHTIANYVPRGTVINTKLTMDVQEECHAEAGVVFTHWDNAPVPPTPSHRRRIKTEEKTAVVAAVWGYRIDSISLPC